MQHRVLWGLAIAAIVLAGIALPASCHWIWSEQHTIDVATLIVLAITAWAVIEYARDTRAQTAALSRRHIEPYLSQEEPVWTPGLQTNTLYHISSPDGSRVTALIKLKLWVGGEPVLYNGHVDNDGLHKGESRWTLAGGQFRGVIEPGHAIIEHLRAKMSQSIALTDLYDPGSQAVSAAFAQLPEPKKIQAQLLVRFPRATEGEGSSRDEWHLQPSTIYYLRWIRQQRQVGEETQDGFVWLPDPNTEERQLPPGANAW